MTDKPPTLRQLLHEFTGEHALLDAPLEFDYMQWVDGRAELARCVVTGLSVRQHEGREVQSLTYDWLEARSPADPAPWDAWAATPYGRRLAYDAPTGTFTPVMSGPLPSRRPRNV